MLERHTRFRPAYASKRYGVHNMEVEFWVRGPKGAVSLRMYTHWYVPEEQQRSFEVQSKYPWEPKDLMQPNIVDVSYHAHAPMYESDYSRGSCYILGGPCYSDGSSLYGNECFREGFLRGGSEWLFARLEEEYAFRFDGGPRPNFTSTEGFFND